MSTTYCLVNQTKREVIWFRHLPASSKREIAGHPAAAAVTAWYMLEHPGDEIAFVADTGHWPFSSGSPKDLDSYREMTDTVVDALIAAEILRDEGRQTYLDDEPDIYCRLLRNIWED